MYKWIRKIKSSFLKRFYIITNGGYSVGQSYGVRFLFDWRHSIDKKVASHLYEDDQLEFIQKTASEIKPDYFFDIGAHAGLYSMLVQNASRTTEVHAFEPDVQNLCQLNANVYLNEFCSQMHIHNFAISSQSGSSYFNRSQETSRGTRHLSEHTGDKIVTKKLDDLFNFEGCSVFMKIDVEGHDIKVIEGGKKLLSSNKCMLLVESSPTNLITVSKILQGMGYEEILTGQFNDHLFQNHKFIG